MMECDSVHATIQRRMKEMDLYVPRDVEVAASAARLHPRPYQVRRLRWDDFTKLNNLYTNSVRPGQKKGDSTVHDLSAVLLKRTGENGYKISFRETHFRPLPRDVDYDTEKNWIPVFEGRQKIKTRKFNDLQALKVVIPRDHHAFYDALPH